MACWYSWTTRVATGYVASADSRGAWWFSLVRSDNPSHPFWGLGRPGHPGARLFRTCALGHPVALIFSFGRPGLPGARFSFASFAWWFVSKDSFGTATLNHLSLDEFTDSSAFASQNNVWQVCSLKASF